MQHTRSVRIGSREVKLANHDESYFPAGGGQVTAGLRGSTVDLDTSVAGGSRTKRSSPEEVSP
jgi:hypothetical protein